MPYIVCPKCAIPTYSAARHSTSDTCPHCDTRLARSPGVGVKTPFWRSGEIVPNALRASVRVAP
jgi:hypothetical protein